jgi:hypothetical protein
MSVIEGEGDFPVARPDFSVDPKQTYWNWSIDFLTAEYPERRSCDIWRTSRQLS